MKNTIKVLGIIAIVAVIGFSMTACDDGNNGGDPTYIDGVTVTFSLDKVSATSFTATVEGANWNINMSNPGYSGSYGLFDTNNREVDVTPTVGSSFSSSIVTAFDITRTSDTILTFILKATYSSVGGTIAINTYTQSLQGCVDVPLQEFLGVNTYKNNTYVINPAKSSITF